MKRLTIRSVAVLSIAVIPLGVKAQNKDLPSIKAPSKQADLRDSVKDKGSEFSKLVEYVQQNGADEELGGGVVQQIGFDADPPIKFIEVPASINPKAWKHRECGVVYQSEAGQKRPSCFYMYSVTGSGQGKVLGYWFRIGLDGRLERAASDVGKADEGGNPIRGSAIWSKQDVNAPEVRKAFAAEMAFWTKDWLKKQKKSSAKKETASIAHPAMSSAQATP